MQCFDPYHMLIQLTCSVSVRVRPVMENDCISLQTLTDGDGKHNNDLDVVSLLEQINTALVSTYSH